MEDCVETDLRAKWMTMTEVLPPEPGASRHPPPEPRLTRDLSCDFFVPIGHPCTIPIHRRRLRTFFLRSRNPKKHFLSKKVPIMTIFYYYLWFGCTHNLPPGIYFVPLINDNSHLQIDLRTPNPHQSITVIRRNGDGHVHVEHYHLINLSLSTMMAAAATATVTTAMTTIKVVTVVAATGTVATGSHQWQWA